MSSISFEDVFRIASCVLSSSHARYILSHVYLFATVFLTPEMSRHTLFLSHCVPHSITAFPYFHALLAIHQIAGATTLDSTGHAIAHVIPPVIAHHAISHIVASHPLSIIGCAPQNHAHTSPVRHAIPATHFAHARYCPPIGAVRASCPQSFLISICF